MRILFIQAVMLLLVSSLVSFGQDKMTLIRKSNSNKQATIIFDRKFEIKTDQECYKTDIVNFHHGNITIIQHNLKKDTLVRNSLYNWVYDTLIISCEQIKCIKTYRYKNRAWTMPFVLLAAATVGSMFFAPLVSATQGKEVAGKLTMLQIGLVAFTLPPILIGTRKVKYDLKNKWKIKPME